MTQRIHNGEVALISGGLGDIGWAICSLLADRGAHIALCDLLPAHAVSDRLDNLKGRGVRVDYTAVDVGDPAEVQRWVRGVAERLGAPSLIVPNAAIVAYCSALSTTPEDFNRHLRINLLGAFFVAQEAAKLLIHGKARGRIVFVGSCVAHAPSPQILPYAVAKAGLRMAVQCMALELAPHGILVNEVAPGFVDAGLSAKEFEQMPGLREACRKAVPTGRLLTPDDVAKAVAFLCHPDASEMTGIHLVVDSGLSLVTPCHQPSPVSSAERKDE